MGFMFRVEQIAVTEEYTVLNGHMISGALDWSQRIELQIVDRGRPDGCLWAEGRTPPATPLPPVERGATALANSNREERIERRIIEGGQRDAHAHPEASASLSPPTPLPPGERGATTSPGRANGEEEHAPAATSITAEKSGPHESAKPTPLASTGDIHIAEDMKTVFAAPLRGVASAEDTGLALFDPSLWEKVLALPLSISREKRIGLILDGIPPCRDLPVPAIAVGIDTSTPMAAEQLQTAFQAADVPVWSGVNFGVPVREYPYQISRRGMLLFAPWGLFFVTIVLSLVFVALAVNKLPLRGDSVGKIIACGMLGCFDVLFLYFSIKMLLAKSLPLVVTTSGMMMPIILPGYHTHTVYISFAEINDVLEYWHADAVQMLKLKTARGVLHVNGFLMHAGHFEELRRLLRGRIHDNRMQDKSHTCAST